MATFKTAVDKLKELSVGLSEEELEELKEIRQQTRTIAEIFGVFGVHDKKRWKEVKERYRKEKEAPRKKLLAMPFIDKCKLFETKLPNAASNDKRNSSRLLLNHISRHKELYMPETKYLTTVSTGQEGRAITSHSWTSSDSSESLDALGAGADTLSKMAYSNTTQSESETTIFDEGSTPVIYNPELATPLHTCIE
ncbi:unnamed protein product [Caenorhabditis sp. 36 PRJEB53466]|nr:unnamed protein product [Caenorhabditis sp. 36 PRJEB53466]